MMVSKERLFAESESTGFRPDVLEKVIHLLNLLEGFYNHPFLKDKFVLKGGTALNLFFFELPRLSVDIDLNYVGEVQREAMMNDRSKIEGSIRAVCSRQGFWVRRSPSEHAGGKWLLRYHSALGQEGTLEIDVNFMFRIPLWPVSILDSHTIGPYRAKKISLVDIHELSAGKITALFARQSARDLFDVNLLLDKTQLSRERIRLGFIVFGAVNRHDWRKVSISDIKFDLSEFKLQLLPLLRIRETAADHEAEEWSKGLLEKCKKRLEIVLPFTDQEREFLDLLLDHGEIKPELLTTDESVVERLNSHPLLKWKAFNIKKSKK